MVVLGAGGWWVLKTQAENEEKARIAAEAKAASEARAAEEKRLAEEKRVVDEALNATLRVQLAEARIKWEALTAEGQAADRQLLELKGEVRSGRDLPAPDRAELAARISAQQGYGDWLQPYLLRHPVKSLLAKMDALLSARAFAAAGESGSALAAGLAQAETEITTQRRDWLTLTAPLLITSEPSGLPFELRDHYGRTFTGHTPGETQAPLGAATVRVSRAGWPEQQHELVLRRGQPGRVEADFAAGALILTSSPSGAEVWQGDRRVGTTPYEAGDAKPGFHEFELRQKGFHAATARVTVLAQKTVRENVTLAAVPKPEDGKTYLIADLGLTLQPITPGSFTMGSASGGDSDERPVTSVTLTQGFWLGRTEVTQGQWSAVMGGNPSNFKGDDRPVEQVSWTEAMEFCRKLTERERAAGRLPAGYAYTLPTEAQWEYACRAGTAGDYAGNLDAMAWYSANSGGTTHPVGQKQANAWGLHDMHGNVWEWCLDWYGNYPGGKVTDPLGASSGSFRVDRGGSGWDVAVRCRSAFRYGNGPGYRRSVLGFRLALAPSH